MQKEIQPLFTWNYVASILHFSALAYVLITLTDDQNRKVQLTKLSFDNLNPTNSRIDIPVKLTDSDRVDLKPIVVAFFGVTSFAHFLYATDFFGSGLYSSQILGFGWNPYRWIEYSISAGLMIYLIAIASGTKDKISAISAALITPGLMVSGYTNERALMQNELHKWSLNSGKFKKPATDPQILYSNLIPAWGLFAVKWYIILSNYSQLASEAKAASTQLDPSVTFMVFSQLVFFSMFGIVQTYQVFRWQTSKPGRIEPSYLAYEKIYIVLSAVTKLLLASTVAYALRN